MSNPSSSDDEPGSSRFANAIRSAAPLLNAGIQMAFAIVIFLFLGRWLDGRWNTTPWLMLVGGFLGAGGGLYSFIKTALAINSKEAKMKDSKEK